MRNERDVQDEIVLRVRSEFTEMPGLQVTPRQAERLWALDRERCRKVLDELIATGFLRQESDGRYRRSTDDLTRGSASRQITPSTPATSRRRPRQHDAV
jgi:hypothetical protein